MSARATATPSRRASPRSGRVLPCHRRVRRGSERREAPDAPAARDRHPGTPRLLRRGSTRSLCPGIEGELGILPAPRAAPHDPRAGRAAGSARGPRRSCSPSPAASCRSGRTASSSWRRRRTWPPRSTCERAQRAREEAERTLESARPRAGRPRASAGRAAEGPAADQGRRAATARGSAPPRVTAVADARLFHWEYKPPPGRARGLPRRGRPAAAGSTSPSAAPRTRRSSCSRPRRSPASGAASRTSPRSRTCA